MTIKKYIIDVAFVAGLLFISNQISIELSTYYSVFTVSDFVANREYGFPLGGILLGSITQIDIWLGCIMSGIVMGITLKDRAIKWGMAYFSAFFGYALYCGAFKLIGYRGEWAMELGVFIGWGIGLFFLIFCIRATREIIFKVRNHLMKNKIEMSTDPQ